MKPLPGCQKGAFSFILGFFAFAFSVSVLGNTVAAFCAAITDAGGGGSHQEVIVAFRIRARAHEFQVWIEVKNGKVGSTEQIVYLPRRFHVFGIIN